MNILERMVAQAAVTASKLGYTGPKSVETAKKTGKLSLTSETHCPECSAPMTKVLLANDLPASACTKGCRIGLPRRVVELKL